MKGFMLLLIGALGGAVLALLFAPESGQALRSQLGSDATAERQRLDAQVDSSLRKIQARVDALHTDLSSYIQNAQQPTSVEADAETEAVVVES